MDSKLVANIEFLPNRVKIKSWKIASKIMSADFLHTLKSKRLAGQTFWRVMIESGVDDPRIQSFRLTRFIKNGEHSIAYLRIARLTG